MSKARIIRTERGLTISDTRVTLYAVMEYLAANWPTSLVRDWLNLTDDQMSAVLDYVAAHRSEVEAEYEQVIRQAELTKAYWEARNERRLTEISALHDSDARPDDPFSRLQAHKAAICGA